ncbi:MAG TPA: glycosyltransferase family 4 protein [Patescibacteria group bacterium]|nr:glycosyltransferase family 4 protein [Patescibacteria group bacterium]
MNILMLTPYLPYPLVSGGQIRTYNLLKNLCTQHNITLFSYIRSDDERKYISKLEPYCKKIVVFKRGPVWTPKNILLSQFSFHPLLVTMYRSIKLEAAIQKELQSNKYNLIHAETFYMMPNIPKTILPVILVVQTIEHLGYKEFTRRLALPFLKPFLYWDVRKIKYWEEHYWRTATRLITMSEEDKQYILHRVQNVGSIDVVANGVDIEFFRQTKKEKTKDFNILFVGTFKWLPNVEAVTYLVERVWKQISAAIPNAKLLIVGNSPSPKIEKYAVDDKTVIVKGHVRDIRDAYSKANVLLAPVWSGKGTRYKILEAMATETPIVATPLAVEGLGVKDGVQALIADTAEDLAASVIKLQSDSKLAATLANNGKQLVEKNYDWKSISKDLDTIYNQVGR